MPTQVQLTEKVYVDDLLIAEREEREAKQLEVDERLEALENYNFVDDYNGAKE